MAGADELEKLRCRVVNSRPKCQAAGSASTSRNCLPVFLVLIFMLLSFSRFCQGKAYHSVRFFIKLSVLKCVCYVVKKNVEKVLDTRSLT